MSEHDHQPPDLLESFLPSETDNEADVRERISRIIRAARLVVPMLLIVSGLLAALAVTGLQLVLPVFPSLYGWLFIALLLILTGVLLAGFRLYRQLLKPLAKLESSVAHVCQGEPDGITNDGGMGVFDNMARDIDSINEELIDLYEDMDSRVARHTTRLAQKTASLKILYDVAASINQGKELDDLLLQFLRVLKEMVNGKAATVRLVTLDGKMRLVGSIGLEDVILTEKDMLPVQLCVCGTALSAGDILCTRDPQRCSAINGRRMFGSDEIEAVSVPLEFHGVMLGAYTIFVERSGISEREDIMDLIATIGSHLGMAVAKHHSDEDSRRLSIVEERTTLAHELHDSLAQTIASLRYQVRMLEDTLRGQEKDKDPYHDLERIRNGLDEAHIELRALLNSFRAPLDEKGLVQALQKLAGRFENETGIHTFFQQDCVQVSLSVAEEMQIVRIVQEALANIRKHAQAQTVRVLLTCQSDNVYHILVEDDGVGFVYTDKEGKPGEHIGLSIMEERAMRLGAEFRVESEEGEGTRIELSYAPGKQQRHNMGKL